MQCRHLVPSETRAIRYRFRLKSVEVGDVVQVEIEQAGVGTLIFHSQRDEFLLQIERDSGGVGIDSEEAAAGFVVGEEVTLDLIEPIMNSPICCPLNS